MSSSMGHGEISVAIACNIIFIIFQKSLIFNKVSLKLNTNP